jgi:hypothetical protein
LISTRTMMMRSPKRIRRRARQGDSRSTSGWIIPYGIRSDAAGRYTAAAISALDTSSGNFVCARHPMQGHPSATRLGASPFFSLRSTLRSSQQQPARLLHALVTSVEKVRSTLARPHFKTSLMLDAIGFAVGGDSSCVVFHPGHTTTFGRRPSYLLAIATVPSPQYRSPSTISRKDSVHSPVAFT